MRMSFHRNPVPPVMLIAFMFFRNEAAIQNCVDISQMFFMPGR